MMRARGLSAAMTLAFLTTSVLAGATTTPAGGSKLPADNPFANDSTLPFQAPPFDKIKDADYQPAIEEGMKQQLAEIEAIAERSGAADVRQHDRRDGALGRAADARREGVLRPRAVEHQRRRCRRSQAEVAPKLAAHHDAIYLNPKLFARVKAIYDAARRRSGSTRVEAASSSATTATSSAPARSSPTPTRRRCARSTRKSRRSRPSSRASSSPTTNGGALVVDDKSELDGLSEADIAAAAEAAKERKLDGKWVLPLQNTTQQPALAYAEEPRDAREALRGLDAPRRARRRERHARDHRAPRPAPRASAPSCSAIRPTPPTSLDDQMAKTPRHARSS